MQFIYFDAQAHLHQTELSKAKHSIADIDVHWLNLGHQVFSQRYHAMACFEAIVSLVPDNHQFTFRSWYDMQMRQTHCVWYSVSKVILESLSGGFQTKNILFMLPRFFPAAYRNKSVLVFVELAGCEVVAGYVRGICVCFKKLPEQTAIHVQHEWLHMQQAHPQWAFDYSIYITSRTGVSNMLVQTHQQTVYVTAQSQTLSNRIMLYGLT